MAIVNCLECDGNGLIGDEICNECDGAGDFAVTLLEETKEIVYEEE